MNCNRNAMLANSVCANAFSAQAICRKHFRVSNFTLAFWRTSVLFVFAGILCGRLLCYNPSMPEEIQKIKERILPILKEAGVLRSSIFGSVVRGEARPDSDVDILVELPKDKSMFDLIELEEKLESILGKKVDVITYRSVHHLLRDIIFKEQIRIL